MKLAKSIFGKKGWNWMFLHICFCTILYYTNKNIQVENQNIKLLNRMIYEIKWLIDRIEYG